MSDTAPCDLHSLQRFAIAGSVIIERGEGGLTRVVVDNRHARAHIYLQGAHVTAYQPQNAAPILWLSPACIFAAGKGLRGGVPICWPWFGAHSSRPELPAHGFARTREWQLVATTSLADGATRIEFGLNHTEQTLAWWPHPFQVRYVVTVGAQLELQLSTTNTDSQPMTCEEALHTYLAVADVRQAAVLGLEGTPYFDKVQQMKPLLQAGAVRLTGETDRVYTPTTSTLIVDDHLHPRRLRILKEGSQSTVVWNPWSAKSAGMADMGAYAWQGMLCVESANALAQACTIAPGATHTLGTTISALPAHQGSR